MYYVCQMHVIENKNNKKLMRCHRAIRTDQNVIFSLVNRRLLLPGAQEEQLKPKIWSARDLGWLVGYRNALMLEAQRKKWN